MVAVIHTTWGEHASPDCTGHRGQGWAQDHSDGMCSDRGPWIGKPGVPDSPRMPAQQTPPERDCPVPSFLFVSPGD